MKISDRTRNKVSKFIRKNVTVYFSEVRALEKKKNGKPLVPRVNFKSLVTILEELEKENKIIIQKIGSVKLIHWVDGYKGKRGA